MLMLKSFLNNILLIKSGLIFVFDCLNIIKLLILMKKDVCWFVLFFFFSNPCVIIVKFCQTLVRILFNIFYDLSEDFVKDTGNYRQVLPEECLSFVHIFLRTTMKILKASKFKEIFLNYKPDIDYSTSFIRIINKHCIDFCNLKFKKAN